MAQIIKVIVELIDRFSKNAKGVERNMNGMSQKAQTLTRESTRLGRTTAELEGGLASQGLAVNRAGKAYEKLTGRIVNQTKAFGRAKAMTNRFRMELLGVMFFGMMIQQVFMGIAKTGVDAFMKITKGQTQAGQAIITLQSGFQYLQYTIGDAIGTAMLPFLDTIVGVIELVGDWIDRNPRLASGLIMVGIAVGTILLLIGSFGLGISSTVQFIGGVGYGLIGALMAIPTPVKIAAIALAAAAIFIITNWDAVGPAFKNTADALSKTFVDLEADLDTMNAAWDKAFDSWVEGGAVVMIRIAREVVKGMAGMFDMVMAAFRWHIQVMMKGIIGPEAARNLAQTFFPSAAGLAASPFLAQLDKWEKDTLKRLHPTTSGMDRSFLKNEYQTKYGILEQGTSMGAGLGAFAERQSIGIGSAEDVVQAGGVKVETLNINMTAELESAIEGGRGFGEEMMRTLQGFGYNVTLSS